MPPHPSTTVPPGPPVLSSTWYPAQDQVCQLSTCSWFCVAIYLLWQPLATRSPACFSSTISLLGYYLLPCAALIKKWHRFSVVCSNPTIPIDPDRFYKRRDVAETHKQYFSKKTYITKMNHSATSYSFFEDFYDKSRQYSNNYKFCSRLVAPITCRIKTLYDIDYHHNPGTLQHAWWLNRFGKEWWAALSWPHHRARNTTMLSQSILKPPLQNL